MRLVIEALLLLGGLVLIMLAFRFIFYPRLSRKLYKRAISVIAYAGYCAVFAYVIYRLSNG
ncbi:hypothetical protein J2S00_003974 [Caldalkalibacillus uzonensis]|uniref:Uncharacterized protein n=1 Tax=Caldalkalibacillus uzonensis TaxID=353224 RepID=A0ABU0CYA5_9BACI|nr:hypothetical protein [Caldalkalibacillus uzonensis]